MTDISDTTFNIYCLVWLDENINTNEYNLIQKNLEFFIDEFQSFNAILSCEQYIRSISINTQVVLILNGNFALQFIPQIHNFKQILDIYNYKSTQIDSSLEFQKVKVKTNDPLFN